MVRKGPFTLEIINAETNKAFQEHTASDGLVYAEAEPDTEYFPLFKNNSSNGVVVIGYIDGDWLGFLSYVAAHHTSKLGIWYNKGVFDHMTTLKFDSLGSHIRSSSDKESSNTCQFGSIKIEILALTINPNMKPTIEFISKWESKLDADENDPASRLKRLQSKVGSTTLLKDDVYKVPRKWDRGEEIKTIEIKYCSTPGLVKKGILPRLPKLESEDDMKSQSDGNCKRRKLSIEPKIIRNSTQDDEGNILKEVKMEMFDLTNASSDDETDDL